MAINNEASNLDISRLSGYNIHNSSGSSSSCCTHCGHSQTTKRTIASTRHTEYADVEKGAYYGDFAPTVTNEVICSSQRGMKGRDSTEVDLKSKGVRIDKSNSLQSAKNERILGLGK
jgi:hypothetical protein